MGTTTLSWNYDSVAGDGFRIYRSGTPMDPEALPTPLAEVALTEREYEDTTVVADETYYYRVSVYAGELENVSEELEHVAVDAGDPLWSSVVALLNFENGFTDEKGFNWSVSGTMPITDTASKFGTHSLDTGAGAVATNNGASLGLTDADGITIEFWMLCTSTATDPEVIFQLGIDNSSSGGRIIGIRIESTDSLRVYFGTSTLNAGIASIPDFALDTWYHVAVQVGPRVSGQRSSKLFINGVLSAGFEAVSLTGLSSSNIFSIGQGYWTGVKRFKGLLDEFRITKGERYTEDFTPPTQPFPNYGT